MVTTRDGCMLHVLSYCCVGDSLEEIERFERARQLQTFVQDRDLHPLWLYEEVTLERPYIPSGKALHSFVCNVIQVFSSQYHQLSDEWGHEGVPLFPLGTLAHKHLHSTRARMQQSVQFPHSHAITSSIPSGRRCWSGH